MAKYPKVEKGLLRLSQGDALRTTSIQLVTGALLSAGLLLAGNTPVEAKSISTPTLSAPLSQGSAIVLGPSARMNSQDNAVLQGHYSHSSHASHASHHSHYSSR